MPQHRRQTRKKRGGFVGPARKFTGIRGKKYKVHSTITEMETPEPYSFIGTFQETKDEAGDAAHFFSTIHFADGTTDTRRRISDTVINTLYVPVLCRPGECEIGGRRRRTQRKTRKGNKHRK
jgi:hypothetical protein